MKHKTFVTLPVTESCRQKMLEMKDSFDFCFTSASEITEEDLQAAEIIIGNLPCDTIRKATSLKWLQLNSAGFAEYLESGILPDGCILTNAAGAYGPAVSEHMLAMIFAMSKKLHLYRDSQNRQCWEDHGTVRPLHGQTALIIGMGDIGSKIAQVLHALGNHVIGIKRNIHNCPDYADRLYTMEQLNEVLPLADLVIVCLPASPENYHFMGEHQFQLMKNTALFFNGGRGSLVDTDALLKAVQEKQIAGAGLEVIEPEPLPSDHPIWKEPDILLTPHCSGGFHMPETLERICGIVLQNLANYKEGLPLINQCNTF